MSPRVLIADDNVRFRAIVKAALKHSLDIRQFAEAGTGREAIRRAQQTKPDLIILDVSMPELDGIQAAKVLKNEMPEVPIVFFTMQNLEQHDPAKFGVDAIVSKMEGIRKLKQCVESLLAAGKPELSLAPIREAAP